jgi:cleavage stimulation factor subunit 1
MELSIERKQVYALIARQLQDDGMHALAERVAQEVGVEIDALLPRDELLSLYQQCLVGNRQSTLLADSSSPDEAMDLDDATKQAESPKPKFAFVARFTAAHKSAVRTAAFSPDGALVASASDDASIKILDVDKMHQHSSARNVGANAESEASKVVYRTFFDHQLPINDLAFHPTRPILVSCSKDASIKFFEHSRSSSRRSFRAIREKVDVRSVDFHPSGDYLLVGTQDHIIRMFDCSSFQAFTSAELSKHHDAGVNSVKWCPTASLFVSCSSDGSIKLWDGVNFRCLRTIEQAHGGSSVQISRFSSDGKFILSGGEDSTARIWDASSGKEICALTSQSLGPSSRLKPCFMYDDRHVLGACDNSPNVFLWDSVSGNLIEEYQGHNRSLYHIEASPIEPSFISCGDDNKARFWGLDDPLN